MSRKQIPLMSMRETRHDVGFRRRSGVFIVNFEDTPHHFLLFLLLTLNRGMLAELLRKKVNMYIYENNFSTEG